MLAERWSRSIRSATRFDCFFARAAANPIDQQKGADEERKYAVQCIARGVRMPVNCAENRAAKEQREQNYKSTRYGNRNVEPAKTFEPLYFHTRIELLFALVCAVNWVRHWP